MRENAFFNGSFLQYSMVFYFSRLKAAKISGGAFGRLLLTGLPQVDDDQQDEHGDKQQGGDGVDLRTDAFLVMA